MSDKYRELLLSSFDPSEFGRSSNRVFTETAHELTDDVTPERLAVLLARLTREATDD